MSDDIPVNDAPRLTALVRALAGRPWRALAVLTAVTVVAGWWGTGIPIKGDMEALFPEDTPTIQRARQARELVGARTELIVLVGSTDPERNRQVAGTIAAELSARTELIERVDFEREVDFFEQNALLYLPVDELKKLDEQVAEVIREAVRKDMALDDFDDEPEDGGADRPHLPTDAELRARYKASDLSRYNETPDGQAIAVKAYPRFKPQDIHRTRAMMHEVDKVIAAATAGKSVETTVVGDYTGVSKSVDQITTALGRSSAVALALIILVLVLYFRRLRAVVLVLVPLIVGILWTTCFARLAIGQLNLISAFIFAILLGLGIDFAVHAMGRVDEAARDGMPLPEALAHALPRLGRAMLVAAATTIATFLSLTLFDFRGFSQFGWIAAGGVALSLTAVYLTLPALSVAMHRLRARPTRPPAPTSTSKSITGSRHIATVAILGTVMAAALAAYGLPDLRFDGDMRKMRMASPPETNTLRLKYFYETTHRSASPALVITDTLAEAEKLFRHLEDEARRSDRISTVASIFSFVPEDQDEKLAIVAEMKRRIDNKYALLEGQDKADADRLRAHLTPRDFGPDDLPEWVRERFTDTTGAFGRYVLIYPVGIKSRAEEVIAIQEAIGTIELDGKTYHSTASWMFTGEAYLTVRREGPLAVGLAALVVFMLLLFDLRHLGRALLTFFPLALGFLAFLGVMGWADIPLNLFNIVVLPTIFGIGVDTAIHLNHRLREGDAVSTVLRTTGASAAVSALTTAIGFASLLVVANEGLRSIGWVAVIGIGCTTLCTTVLITAFETLRRARAGEVAP